MIALVNVALFFRRRYFPDAAGLATFFAESPLRGSGLKVSSLKERPRKINL
jgi:hypothetical protein